MERGKKEEREKEPEREEEKERKITSTQKVLPKHDVNFKLGSSLILKFLTFTFLSHLPLFDTLSSLSLSLIWLQFSFLLVFKKAINLA